MNSFNSFLETANSFLWHNAVLFLVLGTGIVFTLWTRFSQFRSLTHGLHVLRGRYDNPADPGAINHFQALSAALSATVGLGNIGGVALAISLGGPGAVFWMWVVGFFGMALKTTEVTLAMLYRNTTDPDNPHGGAMWVISKALADGPPWRQKLGKLIGGLFCVTLLVTTVTGGNMFQAWNVGNMTELYFDVPGIFAGIALAIIVGLVILGGIHRIGRVAAALVPFMITIYFAAAVYVLAMDAGEIPAMFGLIFRSAFSPTEASGAFIGGTMGYAFLYGMKRAIFSNEAGQGTSPIAHSAAKTSEPVRESVVAGLEPFIDTIVTCTVTALEEADDRGRAGGVHGEGRDRSRERPRGQRRRRDGRRHGERAPGMQHHRATASRKPAPRIISIRPWALKDASAKRNRRTRTSTLRSSMP